MEGNLWENILNNATDPLLSRLRRSFIVGLKLKEACHLDCELPINKEVGEPSPVTNDRRVVLPKPALDDVLTPLTFCSRPTRIHMRQTGTRRSKEQTSGNSNP